MRASGPARALRLWALAGLAVVAVLAAGAARATDITAMRVERAPEGVLLSAQVSFELPEVVDDALRKGIPVFFVAEAVLLRDRWYWSDKEVARATRYMRLSYQPLTRRWRLVLSSAPAAPAVAGGLSLGQSFETRDEALAAVQRISGWKIAEAHEVDDSPRYGVNLRFRLDTSQLPRPFQIGLVGQDDWNIAASLSQRLAAESAR